MKMKSDKDTTGYKKISLIDQLGASLSYDVANKRWSDLSMNLRLKLTKSYTFNMNASFATYAYEFDENGNVVVGDRTEWSYGRFGRFQGYSGSFSYTLNNDTFKKLFGKKEEDERTRTIKGRKKMKTRRQMKKRKNRITTPTCERRRKLLLIQMVTWLSSSRGVSA